MGMQKTRKMLALLEKISSIEKMERGKLCRMGERPHYNLQSWENGKNVVRYVPGSEVAEVTEAIKGYQLFRELTEKYAEEVIKQTRRERQKEKPK
jgi:hypothetical protein